MNRLVAYVLLCGVSAGMTVGFGSMVLLGRYVAIEPNPFILYGELGMAIVSFVYGAYMLLLNAKGRD